MKFPGVVVVNKKDKVNISGTDYSVGMLLPFGSTGGLPDFGEVGLLQLIIVHESPVFALKLLSRWYHVHLRSFKLEPTGELEVLQHSEMKDSYPLAACNTAHGRMVLNTSFAHQSRYTSV